MAVLSRGEEELDCALSLANRLPTLWVEADEGSRWRILKTIFTRFTVDDGKITNVELHVPRNFLARWKPQDAGPPMAIREAIGVYSFATSASEAGCHGSLRTILRI